jgi:hypothetical protein
MYANDDDAMVIWSVPDVIDECLGFAIQRRTFDPRTYDSTDLTGDRMTVMHLNWLPNRLGFVDDPEATPGATRISTKWPFQRFWWTDHDTDEGDIVSYRVVPMVGEVGHLTPLEEWSSQWTPPRVLSAQPRQFNPFFNRGFVISIHGPVPQKHGAQG